MGVGAVGIPIDTAACLDHHPHLQRRVHSRRGPTRVFRSTYPAFEVILIDDGSTDRTPAIAAGFPVRLEPRGPGRAGRGANLGARAAEGDILFFIDSDVMVRPDTLDRLAGGGSFGTGDVDAVCGVQAADMRYREPRQPVQEPLDALDLPAATGDVPLFYTTAAAIRREAFRRVGGFDHGYARPASRTRRSGRSSARLGVRVRVHPDLEVEHVKRYSLGSLLRTDFRRAVVAGPAEAPAPRRARGEQQLRAHGLHREHPARGARHGRARGRRGPSAAGGIAAGAAWPRPSSCSTANSSGPSGSTKVGPGCWRRSLSSGSSCSWPASVRASVSSVTPSENATEGDERRAQWVTRITSGTA